MLDRRLALALVILAACADSEAKPRPPAEQAPIGNEIGQRVPPFTAETIDVTDGKQIGGTFDSAAAGRPTVYLVVGTHCPATAAYMARMGELEKKYRGDKVGFVFVYPNKTDTRDAKMAFHRLHGLSAPMIDDVGAKVATALGATRTSEVIITDAAGVRLYRGAIDDARDPAQVKERYVAAALDQHLAGQPIKVTATNVHA